MSYEQLFKDVNEEMKERLELVMERPRKNQTKLLLQYKD